MKAIILAAGAGRRLGATVPKCLIDIGGASILTRQLAAFRAAGVDEFVIVVGYRRDEVRGHVRGQPGAFSFVVNDRYAETNTIYSLYLAREHIAGAFFYANADVVFDRRLTDRLVSAPAATALAIDRSACAEEEVKVIVRDGRIVRIGKQLAPAMCFGEFVGVARFGAEVAPALVAALTTAVETEGAVGDYFERAVDQLCIDWNLSPVDVSDLPCIEIDFPADLEAARRKIGPRLLDPPT